MNRIRSSKEDLLEYLLNWVSLCPALFFPSPTLMCLTKTFQIFLVPLMPPSFLQVNSLAFPKIDILPLHPGFPAGLYCLCPVGPLKQPPDIWVTGGTVTRGIHYQKTDLPEKFRLDHDDQMQRER